MESLQTVGQVGRYGLGLWLAWEIDRYLAIPKRRLCPRRCRVAELPTARDGGRPGLRKQASTVFPARATTKRPKMNLSTL